jgi:4'-phosphopantetheinyl transferase
LSPPPPEIHVWLAAESLLDDPTTADRLHALLTDDERRRLQDFRAAAPRRLHLIARALQRTALSRLVPAVNAADWRFDRGATGRPALAAAHRLAVDFNIAHTQGVVVMAAGREVRLGIDVERLERRRSLDIARRYFSAHEIAALEALPVDAQARRFVELWTLKEAYLKAVGTGIAGGLGSMTFDWTADGIRFERASDPDAARWRFQQWPWDEEFLVALAWRAPAGPAAHVTVRRLVAEDFSGATS